MKHKSTIKRAAFFTFFFVMQLLVLRSYLPAENPADNRLVYSCSSQVYDAIEVERLALFKQKTGIDVDLYVTTSGTAIQRLKFGFSGLSSTANRIDFRLKEEGYVEIPFCRDPLVVIVNENCPLSDISEKQLRQIFNKEITRWSELGGPDEPIVVIVPRKFTAAYRNFTLQLMEQRDLQFDFMANLSAMVIKAVGRVPSTISFTTKGATVGKSGIKILKIDGRSCQDNDYPYSQTFSFVSAGKPAGLVKKFIDFSFSPEGIALLERRGITPIKSKY